MTCAIEEPQVRFSDPKKEENTLSFLFLLASSNCFSKSRTRAHIRSYGGGFQLSVANRIRHGELREITI